MNEIYKNILNIFANFNSIILNLSSSVTLSSALILFLFSILLFFWGYKIKKIALLIIGFFVGASIALVLSDFFKMTFNNQIILIVILGLTFALLTFFLYFGTIAFFGVIIGCYLGLKLSELIKSEPLITLIICICLALIFAILSIKINKIMFILLTCLVAFFLFRLTITSLKFFNSIPMLEIILSITLLIAGIIYQFYDNFNIEIPKSSDRAPENNPDKH